MRLRQVGDGVSQAFETRISDLVQGVQKLAAQKIDEHDVCLIRQLRDLHAKEVGEKFGLSDGHVRAIWRGATWRHVA
jgi:hypothetical protein